MGNYSKYGAGKTVCYHGHTHDSRKEAERCNELHILLLSGEIRDLKLQKRYLIIPAIHKTLDTGSVYKKGVRKGQKRYKQVTDERATYYIADFVYFDTKLNKTVIEDTKGMRTKEYILKRKLMKQQYCNDNMIFIET